MAGAQVITETPNDVTSENWDALKAAGWRWLSNISWPVVHRQTGIGDHYRSVRYDDDILHRSQRGTVKLGLPYNPCTGRPDPNYFPDGHLCGAYSKH